MTSDAASSPPFVRIGPERPASPVVLSVPHAGRCYPPEMLRAARLPRAVLETLEDRLVDRLVWRAVEAGATAFVAQAPRAEIDLNRDEREIDPALIVPPLASGSTLASPRSRGGLGLIPSRIAGVGAVWKEGITRVELARRLDTVHRPYHAALAAALAEASERFGAAVLLDCHSMPPRAASGGDPQAALVFGDRHGASASAELVDAAVAAARALGWRTARNAPYAGGYIAGRHGDPERGVHAIQLEICRSAYLDAELRAPGPGFAAVCRLVAAVAQALEASLFGSDQPLAAE